MQDKKPVWKTKHHDAYAAIVCKSVKNFSFDDCSVDVAFTLILRCRIEDPEEAEFIKRRFSYRLNEIEHKMFDYDEDDEAAKKKAEEQHKKAYDPKTKILKFVERMDTTADVDPNILSDEITSCPFDYLPAKLRLELTSITDQKNQTFHRFNFFMHKDPRGNAQFSFKKECDKLAEYNVDVNSCVVRPFSEHKGDESQKYWPVVVFDLALYRDPTYLLQSTLIALLLLNFLTLAVFAFETTDYSGKLGYIATLFLGLVAFIPSIRSNLPNLPALTLLEKQVYVTVTLLFLGLIDSVALRMFELNQADIYWNDNITNPGFIVTTTTFSVSVTITFLSLFFWVLRYIMFLRVDHLDPADVVERKQDSNEFSPSDWLPPQEWKYVPGRTRNLIRRDAIYFEGYEYRPPALLSEKGVDTGYYRL